VRAVRMRCTPARDATVRFGPVRRPFFPNLEPEPGPVRPEGPNPEPLWGPVRFRSGSGLLAIWTWTEPRTANLALFPYVIKPNWHFKPIVLPQNASIDAFMIEIMKSLLFFLFYRYKASIYKDPSYCRSVLLPRPFNLTGITGGYG